MLRRKTKLMLRVALTFPIYSKRLDQNQLICEYAQERLVKSCGDFAGKVIKGHSLQIALLPQIIKGLPGFQIPLTMYYLALFSRQNLARSGFLEWEVEDCGCHFPKQCSRMSEMEISLPSRMLPTCVTHLVVQTSKILQSVVELCYKRSLCRHYSRVFTHIAFPNKWYTCQTVYTCMATYQIIHTNSY